MENKKKILVDLYTTKRIEKEQVKTYNSPTVYSVTYEKNEKEGFSLLGNVDSFSVSSNKKENKIIMTEAVIGRETNKFIYITGSFDEVTRLALKLLVVEKKEIGDVGLGALKKFTEGTTKVYGKMIENENTKLNSRQKIQSNLSIAGNSVGHFVDGISYLKKIINDDDNSKIEKNARRFLSFREMEGEVEVDKREFPVVSLIGYTEEMTNEFDEDTDKLNEQIIISNLVFKIQNSCDTIYKNTNINNGYNHNYNHGR